MASERKGKGREQLTEDEPDIKPLTRAKRRLEDSAKPISPPLTQKGEIFVAPKGRSFPEGLGSLGTRALHTQAFVASTGGEVVQARLDSGADITLMSEDFWSSVPGLPKPKEGLRMKLYHLTGSAKVLGYIRTTLFMPRENGSFISFDLEAYVVRNMRVPLLLGEDFQTTYELGVT